MARKKKTVGAIAAPGTTFYTIITTAGLAALAKAQATGVPVTLKQMAVGDSGGQYYDPTPDQTELKNEKWRGNLNAVFVDTDHVTRVIAEGLVPVTTGGWYIREAGIYDADGKLFAIAKVPETYKPDPSEGAADDAYVQLICEVTNSKLVEISVDPSVILATRGWVLLKIKEITDRIQILENERLADDLIAEVAIDQLPSLLNMIPKNLNGKKVSITVKPGKDLQLPDELDINGLYGGDFRLIFPADYITFGSYDLDIVGNTAPVSIVNLHAFDRTNNFIYAKGNRLVTLDDVWFGSGTGELLVNLIDNDRVLVTKQTSLVAAGWEVKGTRLDVLAGSVALRNVTGLSEVYAADGLSNWPETLESGSKIIAPFPRRHWLYGYALDTETPYPIQMPIVSGNYVVTERDGTQVGTVQIVSIHNSQIYYITTSGTLEKKQYYLVGSLGQRVALLSDTESTGLITLTEMWS